MYKNFFSKICTITLLTASFSAQASEPTLGSNYTKFKNYLNDKYGFDYNLTYSLLGQRGSPNGKNNAVQSYLYPSVDWTTFNNNYGTGIINFAYNSVDYGGHNALDINNNTGMVTPINDYDDKSQEFVQLYYSYQLPHEYNWLTLGLGQFPIYNFDGSTYDANQQANFINYALSQNATSSYSTAGIGTFIQATPKDWTFVAGVQDATNVDAPSVRFNHLDDKHYTTFGSVGYAPTIAHLGQAQYSVLVYNQPNVPEQPQSTTGWSVNISQNIGEKFNIFGRVNGVNGDMTDINQSYVAGMVYNNPLNRNALDQIGLAYAYNKINESAVGEPLYHNAEQIIEGFWAWGISKWATITPDFQFYFNPALNQKSDYGTVSSLRFTLFF